MSDPIGVLCDETKRIFTEFIEIHRQQMAMLAKQVKALVASLDYAASGVEADARVVGERGWTIPTWGTIDLVRYLAQFGPDELDEGLLREYSKRRSAREKELLLRLRTTEALLYWRPLLSECIDIYRKRKYRVVVPSLLPIIEGAVVSTLDLYSYRPGLKRIATDQVRVRDPGMMRVAWVSVEAFLNAVFANHDFSASRPTLLNRHWVLHGRDAPEWSRVECLRLFHALDTISVLISSAYTATSA
jgi:hypothetical protein